MNYARPCILIGLKFGKKIFRDEDKNLRTKPGVGHRSNIGFGKAQCYRKYSEPLLSLWGLKVSIVFLQLFFVNEDKSSTPRFPFPIRIFP